MAEPTVPVPVSLIERVEDELAYRVRTAVAMWRAKDRDGGDRSAAVEAQVRDGRIAVRALLSQPTPTGMDSDSAARTADMLDAHLVRVAEGTWSPAQFVDAMADFVTMLRKRAEQPTPTAEPMGSLDAKIDALGLRDPDEPARPDSLPFPHAKADGMLTAPPSIADMVPDWRGGDDESASQ